MRSVDVWNDLPARAMESDILERVKIFIAEYFFEIFYSRVNGLLVKDWKFSFLVFSGRNIWFLLFCFLYSCLFLFLCTHNKERVRVLSYSFD